MNNFYPSRITNSSCWFYSNNEYKFVYIGKVLCHSGHPCPLLPAAENFGNHHFSDPSIGIHTIKPVWIFSPEGEKIKKHAITWSPTDERANQTCRESSPTGERTKQTCGISSPKGERANQPYGIHSPTGERSPKAAAHVRPGAKIHFNPISVVRPWATAETARFPEKILLHHNHLSCYHGNNIN